MGIGGVPAPYLEDLNFQFSISNFKFLIRAERSVVYGDEFYESAIDEYRILIKDFNKSDLCAVSQFQIGKCYYILKNHDQAKIEFEKVIQNYPDSKYVQQAKFYLNKIEKF